MSRRPVTTPAPGTARSGGWGRRLALGAVSLALAACQPAPGAGVALTPVSGPAPAAAAAGPAEAVGAAGPGAAGPGVPLASAAPVQVAPLPAVSVPPPAAGPRPYVPAAAAGGAAPLPSAAPGTVLPASEGTGEAVRYSGAWLVRLDPGATADAVLAALPGFTPRGRLDLAGRALLRLDPPAGLDPLAVRARLVAAPGVATADREVVRHRQDFDFTRPDPLLGAQWAHRADRGNTVGAWELVPAADQRKVIIAVLDTGLDVAHPEFAGRVVDPRNFTGVGADADVTDKDGHGTHVAGIAAAAGDNDAGVAGVAWGAKVMPIKVLADDGGGTDFDIIAGFLHAVRWRPLPEDGSRVRVVNMSLGSPTGAVAAMWVDAVAEATAAGVVVCAAAGNEGAATVGSPANTPGILAVGSSNVYLFWEGISPFSNYGDRVDLAAPGEDILSTAPVFGSPIGVSYAYSSGTSMASPYVAGVAALVVARYDKDNAHLTGAYAETIRRRLLRATTDLGVPGKDPYFGEGRLDARRAVAPATIEAVP